MTDELQIREPLSMDQFENLRKQAIMLIKTGFLPAHIKTPEQAVAIVLIGREMNVPMMQALRKIVVINGVPSVAPELLLALAYRTGQVDDVGIKSLEGGQGMAVTIKRHGMSPVVKTFTMGDATKLGLAEKHNWRAQALTMCQWRALAACLRVTFPDVCLGMYTFEEIAPDITVDAEGVPVSMPDMAPVDDPRPTQEEAPQTHPPVDPTDTRPITEQQRRRLFAIYKSAGWTDEQAHAVVMTAGFETSSAITRAAYLAIVQTLSKPPGKQAE